MPRAEFRRQSGLLLGAPEQSFAVIVNAGRKVHMPVNLSVEHDVCLSFTLVANAQFHL